MSRITKTLIATLLLTLVWPLASEARLVERGVRDSCGDEQTYLAISLAKHEMFERRRARQRPDTPYAAASVAEPAGPVVRKAGTVAVVDDDGTLVSDANPLDLANSGLQFVRKKSGVLGKGFGGGVSDTLGEMITLGDDDSLEVDLAFGFRFFGKRYRKVFVNSDGNLSFGESDTAISARSLSRFVDGPPRIAPFFDDLDPSAATGAGSVYVDNRDNLLRVTWLEVTEYFDPNQGGQANSNTFQVTLHKNGRVTFAYGDLGAQEGVVGVTPGGSGVFDLVDLSTELPLPRRDNAVVERFDLERQIDDYGVVRTFLENFRDDYDVVLIFADFPVDLDDAFAYSITLRNDIRGIGTRGTLPEVYDFTGLVGSSERFQTFTQMGDLSRYPASPRDKFLDPDSALSLIAHEVGHRWLAFVNFEDPNGKVADLMLGRQRAHWNYFFDSDASVLEGNDIRDNGDGTFTTVAATEGYSKLDQYLMGLIPADEVPDSFYVVGENSSRERESNPRVGDTFSGTRVDVSLDQVIAHEGERDPNWMTSPKTFKTAFVVLGRRDQPVSSVSVSKVRKYSKQWVGYFREATDGNGKVKVKLKKRKN